MRGKNRLIAGALSASTVSGLPVFLIGAFSVEIARDISLTSAVLGIVVSLYYASAAFSVVPMSSLSNGIGVHRAVRLGCVFMSVLLALVSLTATHLWQLSILVAGIGVVSAVIEPAVNSMLFHGVPARQRGFAFGIKQSAFPLAVLVTGLLLPTIQLLGGWRNVVLLVGGGCLLVAAVVPTATVTLTSGVTRRAPRLDRAAIRRVRPLAVAFALCIAPASALSAFVVPAAVDRGFDVATAGIVGSVGGAATVVSRVCAGWLVDRFRVHPLALTLGMLGVGTAGYALMVVADADAWMLFCAGTVAAFMFGWGWNGLFNLFVASTFHSNVAHATAVISVGARCGGVIGPLLFGFVAEHFSFRVGWLACIALSAMGIALLIKSRFDMRHRIESGRRDDVIDWLDGEITDRMTEALDATRKSRGFTSNLMRALANAPDAQKEHVRYGHFLRFETKLTEMQREIVICCTVRGSDYAWAHHAGLLARLDGSLDLATIRAGEVPGSLPDDDSALARFALEYSAGTGVSSTTLAAAAHFFSAEQIVEAALLSSYYIGGAALINLFQLPIEPQQILALELAAQDERLREAK